MAPVDLKPPTISGGREVQSLLQMGDIRKRSCIVSDGLVNIVGCLSSAGRASAALKQEGSWFDPGSHILCHLRSWRTGERQDLKSRGGSDTRTSFDSVSAALMKAEALNLLVSSVFVLMFEHL